MSEQNKLVERRLIEEVWNEGNFAVVDDLVAADYVGHSASAEQETRGQQAYKAFYAALREAFPDLEVAIEDQVAEGDRVVTRWTARGTHEGEFRGIPPTGKQGTISGITIDRVAGGKVIECWTVMEELSLLQQLGLARVPAQ